MSHQTTTDKPKRPLSEKQLAARRANAQKSTGPRTPEGKARSSQNARKHGFFTQTALLFYEAPEDFVALRDSYIDEYQPQTPTEMHFVMEMANAQFRLRRVRGLEADLFQILITRELPSRSLSNGEMQAQAFRTLADTSHALHLLQRYEVMFRRQYERALRMLWEHRDRQRELATQTPRPRRRKHKTSLDSPLDFPSPSPPDFPPPSPSDFPPASPSDFPPALAGGCIPTVPDSLSNSASGCIPPVPPPVPQTIAPQHPPNPKTAILRNEPKPAPPKPSRAGAARRAATERLRHNLPNLPTPPTAPQARPSPKRSRMAAARRAAAERLPSVSAGAARRAAAKRSKHHRPHPSNLPSRAARGRAAALHGGLPIALARWLHPAASAIPRRNRAARYSRSTGVNCRPALHRVLCRERRRRQPAKVSGALAAPA